MNVSGDLKKDEELYNEERISKILTKFPELKKQLSELNLLARPLKKGDFDRGYLDLLSQLTVVGDISREGFERRFDRMKRLNNLDEHYFIIVFEDTQSGKVVACSTLSLELKFIHECATRGRLEDVAVLDTYRGKKIGQSIVRLIVELARQLNCYKLSLDCTDELKKFYQLNGFIHGYNMMAIKFLDCL